MPLDHWWADKRYSDALIPATVSIHQLHILLHLLLLLLLNFILRFGWKKKIPFAKNPVRTERALSHRTMRTWPQHLDHLMDFITISFKWTVEWSIIQAVISIGTDFITTHVWPFVVLMRFKSHSANEPLNWIQNMIDRIFKSAQVSRAFKSPRLRWHCPISEKSSLSTEESARWIRTRPMAEIIILWLRFYIPALDSNPIISQDQLHAPICLSKRHRSASWSGRKPQEL